VEKPTKRSEVEKPIRRSEAGQGTKRGAGNKAKRNEEVESAGGSEAKIAKNDEGAIKKRFRATSKELERKRANMERAEAAVRKANQSMEKAIELENKARHAIARAQEMVDQANDALARTTDEYDQASSAFADISVSIGGLITTPQSGEEVAAMDEEDE
jgi:exonuclease VII small subunit